MTRRSLIIIYSTTLVLHAHARAETAESHGRQSLSYIMYRYEAYCRRRLLSIRTRYCGSRSPSGSGTVARPRLDLMLGDWVAVR